MPLTECLLIVIIIVLTFCLYNKWCNNRRGIDKLALPAGRARQHQAAREQFSLPGALGLDESCHTGDESFGYAQAEYGAPGMDFKDWATSQAIDASTVSNHAEFVKDRLEKHNTGRTWSPEQRSEMETTPAVPWAGLMRPQHVPVHNPTQVAEYNENDYDHKRALVWRSG